jgi:hypothetical protein
VLDEELQEVSNPNDDKIETAQIAVLHSIGPSSLSSFCRVGCHKIPWLAPLFIYISQMEHWATREHEQASH